MGYLILEKPRQKHVTLRKRWRNKKHKPYESTKRERGRYYRVHHYTYDEHGRRKSKFCYLGNFEGALEKLRQTKKILEKYATSKKPTDAMYDNKFLVWELESLNYIEYIIKEAKQLKNFKNDPDKFAEIIRDTISESNFFLIRGNRIFQKYR